MEYLEGQIKSEEMWVMYWNAQVLSGAYKLRTTKHADEQLTEFTNDEKLLDALGIMKAHINRYNELITLLANTARRK